jgi:hypothetical protein
LEGGGKEGKKGKNLWSVKTRMTDNILKLLEVIEDEEIFVIPGDYGIRSRDGSGSHSDR